MYVHNNSYTLPLPYQYNVYNLTFIPFILSRMAQKGAHATIHIRCMGNNSPRYDGVINEIPLKAVFEKDAAVIEVGKLVRVKWGGRVWRESVEGRGGEAARDHDR